MMMIPARQFVRQMPILKMKWPDHTAARHLLQGSIDRRPGEAWQLAQCALVDLHWRQVSACLGEDVEDHDPLRGDTKSA